MKFENGYWSAVQEESFRIQAEAKAKKKIVDGETAFWLAKQRVDEACKQPQLGDLVSQTFSLEQACRLLLWPLS